MEIKPLVASVLGKATDEHWGQVLQMPGAYGLIEIDDPSGGARERGISCLAWLSEKVSTGNLNLVEIEAIAEELKNEPVETLILLIPLHTTIHVVLRGKGGVYLKRADAFSVLLSGQGAVSGDVKEKDTLILASRAFTEAVDVHEL
ncbi:MAG: hypothetical protein Q7S76_00710, partial [bacterium]|nr:hypothetical protein [bacterium]